MPYSHLHHIKLIIDLYRRIGEGLEQIKKNAKYVKKINEDLIWIEAKIYIHSLDKKEMERDEVSEEIIIQSLPPEYIEEISSALAEKIANDL